MHKIAQWDHLIKPYKIAFTQEQGTDRLDTIVVEPLEKGFGTTLGNALRRVLLSSIEGTAVTALRVTGVLSEFSTLPGVQEDMTDIVLNLKALSLRMDGNEPRIAKISAKGPCVVTAAMIQDAGIEVLEPLQKICVLQDASTIEMELTLTKGKGYVSAVPSTEHGWSLLGSIALDAHFSPVRRVSYTVESTRVGQSTDYDRLLLTVQTNGSVTPKDAISMAASILQDQLARFVSFELPEMPRTAPTRFDQQEPGKAPFPMVFLKNVKELDLSIRCLNCLKSEGIVYVGDLVKKRDIDLLRTPNFGRKSLTDISNALAQLGLSLGMEHPEWPPEDIEKYLRDRQQEAEGDR